MTETVRTRPTLMALLALAWPIVISRSSQVVVGFTDAAMASRLGQDALAAVTTGAMNAFTLLVLPMGTVFIVSSFASQMSGAGDHAGARRFAWYGMALALIAELLCLAGIAFVPGALEAVGYGARVRELMASYLQVRFLTGGAAVGLEALGNYYGGIGNTRLPMFAQVLAMVLNVVFCWMFIQGHWGAPALGVMGSGLAAALATGIAFVALLACFLLHVGAPHPSVTTSTTPSGQASTSQLTWHELWRMLRFGLPSGFNWFIEFAAFSVFINIVVAGLGTTALAAMMSVMQLNSIAFMPAFGLATAGSIFVGQAIGAKVPDDVPRTVALTLGVTIAWQGLAAICYLTIPRLLLRPFMNDDVATNDAGFLEVGARVLMLSAAWQVFDAVASTLSEALRAAGDTAFSFWARAIIAWVVFVPGAVLSVRYFGAGDVGVVSWLVVYLGLLALTLAVRFRGGRWRTLELIEGSMH